MDSGPLPLPPLLPRRGASAPAPPLPWTVRLIDAAGRLAPLAVMAALAVATTWLVRQTVRPEGDTPEPVVRHIPDYEMRGFTIQRHTAAGPAPSVIEGDQVRHYPDTRTLEIDQVRVSWVDAQGRRTLMRAARAVVPDDRSEVLLQGNARLVREPLRAGEEAFEFRGERLRFDSDTQRVRADQPVTLKQGASVFEADGLDYDHRTGVAELLGHVRGHVRGLR
ncbi:MAG: LPS export ABC transporter periplasmic protein LptC [Burkholderiales bacterium]